MQIQKKAGIAINYNYIKVDFDWKTEKRFKKSLYNDKGINSLREYNNYKSIRTQHYNVSIRCSSYIK
jgi:hypothetical protein